MTELAKKLAGKFIVIDGPDGAGKTTHVKLLTEFLREAGLAVATVRDPGGTEIGDKIRRILLDRGHGDMTVECELMLYMASRAQLATEVIRPALASRQCVLGDRYISSTIAYQGAGGADVQAVRQVGRAAVGDTWPGLTIILDIEPEEGLARAGGAGRPDRIESRDIEFHKKVRDMFLKQADDEPERFAVVDASGDIEHVQQRLRDIVTKWRPQG